jgi:hypothetical protein
MKWPVQSRAGRLPRIKMTNPIVCIQCEEWEALVTSAYRSVTVQLETTKETLK